MTQLRLLEGLYLTNLFINLGQIVHGMLLSEPLSSNVLWHFRSREPNGAKKTVRESSCYQTLSMFLHPGGLNKASPMQSSWEIRSRHWLEDVWKMLVFITFTNASQTDLFSVHSVLKEIFLSKPKPLYMSIFDSSRLFICTHT